MKFSNKNDYGNEIEYSVPEGSDLDDVLDSFVDFLRGCGYNIDYSKCLAIVNPEVFADSVIKDAEQDLDPQQKFSWAEDDEEIVRRPDEPYWDYMARKLRQISKDSGDRWDVE
jgi:hypothetical protein